MSRMLNRGSICLISLLFLAGCAQKKIFVENLLIVKPGAPVDHWTKTTDGWTLHIREYRPAKIDPARPPVILCHGLSHNNNFWDLTENTSLAQYLQSAGFDVWAVSLRGAGQSTKPTLSQIRQLFRLEISIFNPRGLANRRTGLIRTNWTVDDHINFDIPATLTYVTKTAKAKQVFWVGHSMGSMIMFAYLGTRQDPRIKGFVALSAPMYLVHPANDIYELMAGQTNFVQVGNLATGTNLRAIFGTLAGDAVKTPIDQLFLNEDNVDPDLLRVFYYANQEDISPGQLDQLLQYVKTGSFISYDGKTNYTRNLDKVTVPVVQILGQLDNMAEPGFAAEVISEKLERSTVLMFVGTKN